MKILIVDDSELIRQRLVDLIREFEEIKNIDLAGNAEEAYASCSESYPEVIILDIHLPGENGIKILEKIRKKNEVVKIIILTNFPYPQYRKKCMELGADYFVDKTNEFASVGDILKGIYEGGETKEEGRGKKDEGGRRNEE
ncbi:MAG: response regulator transcription factor [Bacteroidales bacterium]|nr:response regulator transcription factor [Bacteroidales bacterium]